MLSWGDTRCVRQYRQHDKHVGGGQDKVRRGGSGCPAAQGSREEACLSENGCQADTSQSSPTMVAKQRAKQKEREREKRRDCGMEKRAEREECGAEEQVGGRGV
jgi:hypothetical protein